MHTRALPLITLSAAVLLGAGCPETTLRGLNLGSTAIVTGDFDTVEQLVQDVALETTVNATIENYDGYIDGPRYESEATVQAGQLALQVEDLLRGAATGGILQFETVIFSDGMRGCNELVYNGVAEDNHLVIDETVRSNIDRAVRNGARVWFSDWTYDLMEATFPDLVDWVGDDTELDRAQRGIAPQVVNAKIVSADLADFMQLEVGSELEIVFNFGDWAVVDSVADTVDVLLTADVTYDDPVTGETVVKEDAPLMLAAPVGSGIVLFTSFHNEAQISDDTHDVLRFGLGQLSR